MTQPARTGGTANPALVVLAVLIGGWAVGVTLALQGLGWLAEQLLLYYTGHRPAWGWPGVALLNAGLVAGPAAVLAVLPRAPAAVRVTGRAWLAGAAAAGLLGSLRAVPGAEPELHLALLALAAGALALALTWLARRAEPAAPGEGAPDGARAGRGWFGVAGGLAVLLPWLWVGGLGGRLETVLAVVAAAAVGWLAGTVLDHRFWAPFQASRVRRVLLGGLVAGVTLLLLAAGVGGSGGQLPLLLVLPALGFAAAGLTGGARWPTAVLVGLAVLGPLALLDPEEVSLLLTTSRDVPFWAGVATAGGLLAAALLGAGLPFLPGRRWVAAAAAGALAVTAGGVNLGLGQPGLHGERLFVVLADQPELAGLPAGTGPAGREARAAAVYRRLVAHAGQSQSGIRAELDRRGLAYTPYYLVNALEVTGGAAVRAWLSGRDDVDRVLRSQRLRPLPAAGGPIRAAPGLAPEGPEWNIALVRAERVWEELGVTGAGVVIGSSDSGVDGTHPALAAGFRGGGDSWLDPANRTRVPTDGYGHGTHTLGSAVGRGGIGVAPGAKWTGCANLDRGLGNPARYLDCLQFMLAPYPSGGDPWRDGDPGRAPHILTNSWGCPPIEGCDQRVLRPATAALTAAGSYLVVAAGNAGPFCGSINDPPATYPEVLTVGAVDRDQQVTVFSSRGPVAGAEKPDLVAPGARVASAVPGGGYRRLDGTSMAAPHVAGVVALMWSANPALIGDRRPPPGSCGRPPAR